MRFEKLSGSPQFIESSHVSGASERNFRDHAVELLCRKFVELYEKYESEGKYSKQIEANLRAVRNSVITVPVLNVLVEKASILRAMILGISRFILLPARAIIINTITILL